MHLEGLDGAVVQLPIKSAQVLLEELIRTELKSDDVSLTVTAGSVKGDNYIGVVFRAQAECRKTGKKLKVIAKLPPQNEARRKQFFVRPSFEREISFYTEIYPMMEQFQREKGIDPENSLDAFNQIPRCYRTCLVELEEAILMGDLRAEGFEMFDRHQNQDLDHIKLVIETLARFHALSFALKDQQPERIERFKHMIELFTTREEDESMQQWFDLLIARTLETLDKEAEPEVYEKTEKVLTGKFMDMVKELTLGAEAEPYTVICHGDCWNNNMMFKYENGTPVAICLLDWQICRYASPVLDLMYYIFTATTKAFRDLHYEHLMNIYHESVSNFLRKLGSDPEQLFPRKALNDQLHRYGRFGLLMSVMLLPIITTKSEDVPDLEGIADKLENGIDFAQEVQSFRSTDTEEMYKELMAGCCRDMVRLGYI